MAYYNVCPNCGCNLDPGERCDCESVRAKERETSRLFYNQILKTDEKGGQISFDFDYKKGGAIGA